LNYLLFMKRAGKNLKKRSVTGFKEGPRLWDWAITEEADGMILRFVKVPRRIRYVPVTDIVPPAAPCRPTTAGTGHAYKKSIALDRSRRSSIAGRIIKSLFQRRSLVGMTSGALIITVALLPLLSAFEAHVINVTAKIEPRPCTTVTFDSDASGEAISAGQLINNEYMPWGLAINVHNNSGGPHIGIAFDSDNPTGEDMDLGTPNEDFGGPGIGIGGMAGALGENSIAQHNVLVIAENDDDDNNDGLIDTPDDEGAGGVIKFIFAQETTVETLRIFDIEEAGGEVKLYNAGGSNFSSRALSALGDNAAETISVFEDGIKEMHVFFPGSGAVDDICFNVLELPPQCDALSLRYWRDHEGCFRGTGSSIWASEINDLSSDFSGVFASHSGGQICEDLWVANCPAGDPVEGRRCRATIHALTDELNIVSGHLDADAFIAGADDGNFAFDRLGLSPFSTIGEALTVIEAVIANPVSTIQELQDVMYVARRIYEFYGGENPLAPMCIFSPDDIPLSFSVNGAGISAENSGDINDDDIYYIGVEEDADVGTNISGELADELTDVSAGDFSVSTTAPLILDLPSDSASTTADDSGNSTVIPDDNAAVSTTETAENENNIGAMNGGDTAEETGAVDEEPENQSASGDFEAEEEAGERADAEADGNESEEQDADAENGTVDADAILEDDPVIVTEA